MALIVVSGAIANKLYQGGEAWVRLSYVQGLQRLGHEVHFLEQIARSACVDKDGQAAEFEASLNRSYFNEVIRAFGLTDAATLLPMDGNGHADIPDDLLQLADSADLLLNISGHLSIEGLFARFRKKVLIDIDPGYTQFWHAAGNPGALVDGHDEFFTIGENIGRADCGIPTNGIHWRSTRPPVVLSEWPLVPPSASTSPRFTTIANWRGAYGGVEFNGQTFGQKAHEFRRLLELPTRSPATFEIALNIHPGDERDRTALLENGWQLTDPQAASLTPDDFRQYVQQSGAEFSVAQGIYVQTNSGWFSDRTTRYLASGRPALVQETGFSRYLPTGKGLLTFRSLDEAVQAANTIAADYESHCHAAREMAEQYFDSDLILGRLLEELGIS